MNVPTKSLEFIITRTFNAPLEQVWKAFTELEHLKKWWGPKGFTIGPADLDFRPGGTFHYRMESPESQMWGKFIYRKIIPSEELVFVNSFADEEGNVIRPPFEDPWPWEILHTITFSERENKTIITLRAEPLNATAEEQAIFAANHESMHQGFTGTWEKLEEHLSMSST